MQNSFIQNPSEQHIVEIESFICYLPDSKHLAIMISPDGLYNTSMKTLECPFELQKLPFEAASDAAYMDGIET